MCLGASGVAQLCMGAEPGKFLFEYSFTLDQTIVYDKHINLNKYNFHNLQVSTWTVFPPIIASYHVGTWQVNKVSNIGRMCPFRAAPPDFNPRVHFALYP